TTAIRIDAGLETDIRTVIVSDDRAGLIFQKLGMRERILFGIPFGIRFEMDFFKPVWRVACRSAADGGFAGHMLESIAQDPLKRSLQMVVSSCQKNIRKNGRGVTACAP